MAQEKKQNDFFQVAHPGWIGLIGFGLYLLTMSAFSPENIPSFLGPVGKFGQTLGTNYPQAIKGLFVLTVIIHAGEAVYTSHLCRERKLNSSATVKWTLQTFLFGFASIIRLKPYRPKKS